MDIVIFQQEENLADSLGSFRDLFYGRQMKYLASDLLKEGLTAIEVRQAIQKAMTICRTAHLETRQHFLPVYTQVESSLVKDCKLSSLGYGLTLLNADVNNPIAARWQLKVVKDFLEK